MRLIDADALKELILAERDKIPKKVPCATYEIMREKDNQHGNAMRGGIRVALRCMENTPTIEAEPVRHGRWKYTLYDRVGTLTTDGDVTCRDCGGRFFRVIGTWYKYCPNCGAKMDGGADHAGEGA